MKFLRMAHLVACAAVVLLVSPGARAGEKTLMHCFAWTPIKDATPADWQAFYQASDALPAKIKGITKVWYGKLQSPLHQMGMEGPAAREYGMCMEMAGPDALKAYAQDPYHKTWVEAYSKVRVEGTTTFSSPYRSLSRTLP